MKSSSINARRSTSLLIDRVRYLFEFEFAAVLEAEAEFDAAVEAEAAIAVAWPWAIFQPSSVLRQICVTRYWPSTLFPMFTPLTVALAITIAPEALGFRLTVTSS